MAATPAQPRSQPQPRTPPPSSSSSSSSLLSHSAFSSQAVKSVQQHQQQKHYREAMPASASAVEVHLTRPPPPEYAWRSRNASLSAGGEEMSGEKGFDRSSRDYPIQGCFPGSKRLNHEENSSKSGTGVARKNNAEEDTQDDEIFPLTWTQPSLICLSEEQILPGPSAVGPKEVNGIAAPCTPFSNDLPRCKMCEKASQMIGLTAL